MRVSATILIVACCSASLVGCCNRFHRHSCLFGNRNKHNECVDQQDWDDDDGHSDGCPCDGGMSYGNSMPMQSFDSGCGCGGGGGMPQFMDAGMPMSYPQQSSGCGCGAGGAGGGMMMGTPMPTYNNQSMMMQPVPEATPTPVPSAMPPAAPPASSVPPTTEYYSPRTITPTSSVPAAF